METYVKAFYLTENEMERWIREHKVMSVTIRYMHRKYRKPLFQHDKF